MRKTRYTLEIDAAAGKHGLDPLLVEAVVLQESSGNTDAFRFEPDFWNRYLKLLPAYDGANPRRVSASYGLMQIMFRVAVERGFDPALPPETLFVPETGLEYGCRQLAHLRDWARGRNVPDDRLSECILASYNGGTGGNDPSKNLPLRNAKYAREVLARYTELKG